MKGPHWDNLSGIHGARDLFGGDERISRMMGLWKEHGQLKQEMEEFNKKCENVPLVEAADGTKEPNFDNELVKEGVALARQDVCRTASFMTMRAPAPRISSSAPATW